MALILQIREDNIKKQCKLASSMLKAGKIIAYPTETSYGLACLASNPQLVKKLAKIKKQPLNKPISVLVSSKKMIKENFELNETARKLIHNFFPGALTLICKKKKGKIKGLKQEKIAFRISSNEFAFLLTKFCGEPITATSANIHGNKDNYDSVKLIELFANKIDCICDAGKIPEIKPSTIYDCKEKKILREGNITKKQIEKVLK
ncbi:MAG: threonylcarbamoyl-AMP synthase [Candidatus Diapherotrites archaeon]|nr:threonylcarbamoyl-AMP synthase [Candidatus Diapherotrites archaeon]